MRPCMAPRMKMVARPYRIEVVALGHHGKLEKTYRVVLFVGTIKTKLDRQHFVRNSAYI